MFLFALKVCVILYGLKSVLQIRIAILYLEMVLLVVCNTKKEQPWYYGYRINLEYLFKILRRQVMLKIIDNAGLYLFTLNHNA